MQGSVDTILAMCHQAAYNEYRRSFAGIGNPTAQIFGQQQQ